MYLSSSARAIALPFFRVLISQMTEAAPSSRFDSTVKYFRLLIPLCISVPEEETKMAIHEQATVIAIIIFTIFLIPVLSIDLLHR